MDNVASVFWRLTEEGMPSGEIGRHPAYLAAIEREKLAHSDGCPSRADILSLCRCRFRSTF